MSKTLKATLTQMQPTLDVARNLDVLLSLVRDAAKDEPDLILLPENALCLGSNAAMREAAIHHDGAELKALAAAAKAAEAVLVLGGFKCIGPDGVIRNTEFVIGPDGVIQGGYDKVHLFNARVNGQVFNASSVEKAGEDLAIAEVNGIKLGLSICYDVRFPEMFRQLAIHGAEVLLIPAAFTHTTGQAHWETLLRARAIESSAYVLASATIRGEHSKADGFETWGHALAVDPWGTVLADLGEVDYGWKTLTLDMAEVARIRGNFTVLEGVRNDVYVRPPRILTVRQG